MVAQRASDRFALVVLLSASMGLAACADDDVATPPPSTGGTSQPTPPLPSTGSPGTIPTFNFTVGVDGPADTVPPPELPGAPKVFPDEPTKRKIWAIDERRHLVRILATDPSNVIDVALIDMPEDAKNEQFVGLDFRPTDGELYAMTNASRLYKINLALAKATPIGSPTSPALSGQAYGFDFDPVADEIRTHSDVDQNLRIDPSTGAVVSVDAMLVFAPDDVNFRQSPNLVGTAYTSSVAPTPTATALYAIDSTRDLLTKIDPPNEGLVVTVGALGVDITEMVGFDIWGSGAKLEAYAAMRVDGEATTGLYTIDLATGKATLVGPVAHPTPLRGIAVEP